MFSIVGKALASTASLCQWRSGPCCLDNFRQFTQLYVQAVLLRRHSKREGGIMLVEHNVGLQLNVRLKGQRGEGWRRGGSVKEEGRGEGIHIKDLD